MYQINFVYKLEKPERSGNFSGLESNILYRTMSAGPSIIVEKIPPLEVLMLPGHISRQRRVIDGQIVDPQTVNVCDTWRFMSFYRVMNYDIQIVEDFLNQATKKMARLNGYFLITIRKVF